MSDVYPTLAGLGYSVEKTPNFSTKVQKAVSGKEYRAAFFSYPIWEFKLTYNFLRDNTTNNELKQLLGFFLKTYGGFTPFFLNDPSDNAVTNQSFGTGDGTTVGFQLVRTYGGGGFTFNEPVVALNGSPTIKDNGSTVSGANYSITNGLVTFNTPPVSGHALTWTGAFYYYVRFKEDSQLFSQFMNNLWEAKNVHMIGVKI